jgi:hypothetical protein
LVSAPKPVRVFFQELKHGDLLKFRAQSNQAPSGGGARDLRFPAIPYFDLLSPMFPEEADHAGARRGIIRWAVATGTGTATVTLWPANVARPSESRIGRFYEVAGWEVDEEAFEADLDRGMKWFVLLVQLDNGQVWARTLRESDLAKEQSWFAECVRRKSDETPAAQSARGFISRDNGAECI